MDIATIGGFIS